MKVACIVLAHRSPEQLGLLLSALRSPELRVYLHLDSRARLDGFRPTLSEATAHGVTMLRRRPTRWGGPEILDATIEGLARGVRDGCDYFVLISGQDFPLRPVDEIVGFIEGNRTKSYIRYWELPTPRWRYEGRDRIQFYTYDVFGRRETCIPAGEDMSMFNWRGRALNRVLRARTLLQGERRFPSYARAVGGIQWWNLTAAAAQYVLTFLGEHPDYRHYHQHTLAPDELFFHSILLGTEFATAAEIINDDLRYMDWDPGSDHPRTLTSDDLKAMLGAGDLFARKFDLAMDRRVLCDLQERVSR
jgi:Core-2/I-Branching enzyme